MQAQSDDAASLAGLLHELAVAMSALDSRIARRLGLSPTEYVAMKHVMAGASVGEPIGPARLARLLGMSTGSVTALVDRLEGAGHVRRVRHDADRRRVVLTASPATVRRVGRELTPLAADVTELGGTFDTAERAVIHRFLADLTTRYAAHAEPAPARGRR